MFIKLEHWWWWLYSNYARLNDTHVGNDKLPFICYIRNDIMLKGFCLKHERHCHSKWKHSMYIHWRVAFVEIRFIFAMHKVTENRKLLLLHKSQAQFLASLYYGLCKLHMFPHAARLHKFIGNKQILKISQNLLSFYSRIYCVKPGKSLSWNRVYLFHTINNICYIEFYPY